MQAVRVVLLISGSHLLLLQLLDLQILQVQLHQLTHQRVQFLQQRFTEG